MGPNPGRGSGGIAQEEQTRAAFIKQREKVHTGRGSIIGQYLVNGQQVKGDESSSVQELVTAAERDATDAITRARIPRRYHDAVKKYFSDLQERLGNKDPDDPGAGVTSPMESARTEVRGSLEGDDPSDDTPPDNR